MKVKKIVKSLPGMRVILRFRIFFKYYSKNLKRGFLWAFKSTENANFYYDITQLNRNQLIQSTATVLNATFTEIESYFVELESNLNLRQEIKEKLISHGEPSAIEVFFGRRVVWYAFVRKLKPKLVVETGVAHGVGSCVISSALLRNQSEGQPGRYLGTDIDSEAGAVYSGNLAQVGVIEFGDSIETLCKVQEKIDIFINDSDHSSTYEFKEYETILGKLLRHWDHSGG